MSDLIVSRTNLDSVAQLLTGKGTGDGTGAGTADDAAKALLLQLVTHLQAAMGDLEDAAVTIVPASDDDDTGSIGDQFADAFTPAAASHAVEIRLHKVHRA